MAILEGDTAKEFAEKIRLRNIQLVEESLKEEKLKAIQTGKEIFNYEKLETFVDSSDYQKAKTREEHVKKLEYAYYVTWSKIMSVEEFAKHIVEIYRWAD
jgi:hypothetical protein